MNKDIWGKKDVAAHSQCTPNTFERIKGVYFVRISYSIWPDCAEKQIIAMFFFSYSLVLGRASGCANTYTQRTQAHALRSQGPECPFFSPVRPSHASSNCVDFFLLSISQLFIHVVYNYLLLFGWWVVRDGVCVCVPEYLVYSAFVTASVSGSLMCVRKFFSVCQSKFTFTYWWIRPRGRSLNCVQT